MTLRVLSIIAVAVAATAFGVALVGGATTTPVANASSSDSCVLPQPCVTEKLILFSISHGHPRAGGTFTGELISVREPGTVHGIRITCGRGRVGGRSVSATLHTYFPATGGLPLSAATCSWRIPKSVASGSLVVSKTIVTVSNEVGNRSVTTWERASWTVAQ